MSYNISSQRKTLGKENKKCIDVLNEKYNLSQLNRIIGKNRKTA